MRGLFALGSRAVLVRFARFRLNDLGCACPFRASSTTDLANGCPQPLEVGAVEAVLQSSVEGLLCVPVPWGNNAVEFYVPVEPAEGRGG